MKNFRIFLSLIFCVVVSTMFSPVFAGEGHDHGKKKSHEGHKHKEGEEGEDEHGHGGDEHEDGPIELSEESQELGGIETIKVSKSSFSSKVQVSGRVAQDVEDVRYISSSEAATVKECTVSLGSNVEKDQVLCTVIPNSSNEPLELKSPIAGTIISEFVKKGEHVDETTALYAIADLANLWANFDVYEKDIGSIKLGQKMYVYPLAYPDKTFKGEIVFISPRVDEATYTVKIRARVSNKKYALKLGMSIRGEILIDSESSGITVPTEAIQTVENKTVVFKKTKEGFEPQEVVIKSQTKETAAIEEGLKEGDEIVVKGSFILKSKMLESEMGHDHDH